MGITRRCWMVPALLGLVLVPRAVGGEEVGPSCDGPPDGVSAEERSRIQQAIPAKASAPAAKGRRLLVIDLNVGRPGHRSIPHANLAVRLMGEKTGAYEAVISHDRSMLAPDRLKAFDAVFLNNTIGPIFDTRELREGFSAFISGGGGLVANHAVTVTSPEWPEFGEILGARGAAHRDADEKVTVRLDDPASPLNAAFGGKGFAIADEIFRFQAPYSRRRVHVLLSVDVAKTDMNQGRPRGQCVREDNDYPISWILRHGKGRVFYCSLGHNPYVFWDARMLRHFLAGIQFALGDLKADTTPSAERGEDAPAVPQSVTELWADFDPRAEPLEVEVAAEWADDAGVYQVLRYTIGTFKGAKARMAAFYGRPKTEGKVPGLLHMHGGGQRASLDAVEYYVGRGYACISVNWGGRPMDEKHPEWPNTDWGAVDPTQSNVPGYASLKPTPKSLASFPSPKNNNWYLLTLACRRALTFLERRPEVDGQRLGIFGHSMGGNLTFYVAGTDARVKAAVPSVGGVGFRTHDVPGIPGTARKIDGSDAATALFRKTIASEAYAPHVGCPILFLGATNDFNSRMESVYRCYGLLRHRNQRFTLAPHLNHRFLDENEVCRPLWLDAHLKGGFAFPKTPAAELILDRPDGVPRVRVTPDRAKRVAAVDIYYAIDPDALARFWRDAGARQEGDAWLGECPIMDLDRPLVAFANVHYDLDRPETLSRGRRVERFCLSSGLLTATPEMLRKAGVKATDRRSLVIDDFKRGFHDWYVLARGNPHHWQFWTRKVTDPKWRGPKGARLALEVKSARENRLVVIVCENEWRGYRGRRKEYAAEVSLKASDDWQEIRLQAADFKNAKDAAPLAAWDELDQLGLRAYADIVQDGKPARLGGQWAGPMPEFHIVRWIID